jgi:hypothetical protein
VRGIGLLRISCIITFACIKDYLPYLNRLIYGYNTREVCARRIHPLLRIQITYNLKF